MCWRTTSHRVRASPSCETARPCQKPQAGLHYSRFCIVSAVRSLYRSSRHAKLSSRGHRRSVLAHRRVQFPRAEAAGENPFPLQIPFGRPRTTADFAEVRPESESLTTVRHEWRDRLARSSDSQVGTSTLAHANRIRFCRRDGSRVGTFRRPQGIPGVATANKR